MYVKSKLKLSYAIIKKRIILKSKANKQIF